MLNRLRCKIKNLLAEASEKYYISRIVVVMSVLAVVVAGIIALCIGVSNGNAVALHIFYAIAIALLAVFGAGIILWVVGICVTLSDY